MTKAIWIIGYIASVVVVNILFAWRPDLAWLWSVIVGSIFVTRDFTQRAIGHWVVVPMLIAIALSYFLASPFVAIASATAFAVSEATDWLIFTITKRPLRDRVLWSCAASAPVDSAVFLLMIGAFGPAAMAAQIASKLVAAVVVWGGLSWQPRTN
jgi:uncharacterized PurR-regulated membrane protein YhhQ (DUF165 family)